MSGTRRPSSLFCAGAASSTRTRKRGRPARTLTGFRFPDHPEFRPNLSPRDIFKLGSFGGTYWRPIDSGVTKSSHRNAHHQLPSAWWAGIPEQHLTSSVYDPAVNRYRVKVGSSLEDWEHRHWIVAADPYGWVQWYCRFFEGRRSPDDARQIKRWQGVAGASGRFRNWLIARIADQGGEWGDASISPKIRQTLQHWAYKLTLADYRAGRAR